MFAPYKVHSLSWTVLSLYCNEESLDLLTVATIPCSVSSWFLILLLCSVTQVLIIQTEGKDMYFDCFCSRFFSKSFWKWHHYSFTLVFQSYHQLCCEQDFTHSLLYSSSKCVFAQISAEVRHWLVQPFDLVQLIPKKNLKKVSLDNGILLTV